MASALTATFAGGSVVLFDAGEGCARAMLRDGIDLNAIERVAISHTHADHWTGLPALITGWALAGRETPVTIHVPPSSEEVFESLLSFCYSFRQRLPYQLTFAGLDGIALPEGWRVETFETTHLAKVRELAEEYGRAPVAYGYLLRKPERKVVLSQDIGSEEDLRDHLDGAELLICESAHVDPATVLAMTRDASVRQVIFTHVPPGGAAFPAAFDGVAWSVAVDGMRVGL
jgi:ribonuclease BN (tRNA processing enzyme)